MLTNKELKRLNKKLAEVFGSEIDGTAKWRVVWAPDQFENRHGKHVDISSNGQFLKEVEETRYVRKYLWIGEKYVLEKWGPNVLTEVKSDKNGVYELVVPLPKFKDPYFEAIEFFLKVGMEGGEKVAEQYIEKVAKNEEEKSEEYYQYCMEILNDERDPSYRNAVSVS